jgi:hypothetical protein
VQPFWKTIWRLLKNLNIDLPYDTAIPLLGIYPKECNTGWASHQVKGPQSWGAIHWNEKYPWSTTLRVQRTPEHEVLEIYMMTLINFSQILTKAVVQFCPE